jgi:signal transduction histidine kinase
MRFIPTVAAVPILILLLTWLSVRAFDPDAERFDFALREVSRFARLEADLQRDVLSARAGVLRNYDPLVRDTDALNDSIDRLQRIPALNRATKSAIDDLAITVTRQEDFVEQFKSDNALLQNSLAYLASFSSDVFGAFAPPVSALAAAMLHLTLDTSPASQRAVQDRLDDLARRTTSSGDENVSIGPLLAHGRLLLDLLPATDAVLAALRANPLAQDQETLRVSLRAQQALSRATARRFRLFLYGASLLLLGLLVHVGFQLHARSRTLLRRAAFELALANVSMRIANAHGRDLDAVISRALADMAQCVGAERAYFLRSESSARNYTWCGRDAAFALGWPDQALALADRVGASMHGIVHVPDVRRLPSGRDRDALGAAGVRGWTCIVRHKVEGKRILLGFDAVRHPLRIPFGGELGLLPMALDTILNALSRQFFEQERERLQLRLQQARRLETVGTLASGIAHNFNNIVGAILGYTEMADKPHAPSGVLDAIRNAGERARELVDQILSFARPRDLQRSPISLQVLVAEAASLLRASLPSTVELAVHEPPNELVVLGVPAQLQQVILNLCNNAAQAMEHVGRIDLEIDTHELMAARVFSRGSLPPGRYACIAVSDTGRGIDKADLERIFEPFFTTRVTGSGLGLATTRDIVLEHAGAMNVSSTVGAGSRFEVWLPRSAEPASRSGHSTDAVALGRGESVLIVGDDAERLLRDEEIVAALGYEPVGFASGADAEAVCRKSPDRFDAMVIGHLGSTTKALDLATRLHEIAPSLPILLATASVDNFDANSLVVAGIADVVAWPITSAELAAALQVCLKPRSPLPHLAAFR